jgi:hypothetical protein
VTWIEQSFLIIGVPRFPKISTLGVNRVPRSCRLEFPRGGPLHFALLCALIDA